MSGEAKRLSVNMSSITASKLSLLASRHGDNITDSVARAIAIAHYLDEVIEQGGNVLVQTADVTHELVIL